MKMKNGFDNDIIVGIDIGSENIFCSKDKVLFSESIFVSERFVPL